MASYDVFVAYAGPNEPYARALWEALVKDLGKDRVFFDKEQPPGTAWFKEVPTALVGSRLTAAVLAREPNGGCGSFGDIPRIARVAYRSGCGPSGRISILGFRVARSLP